METKKQIQKVYESFNGSYWYLTEFLYEQDDEVSEKDKIWFGYAVLSGMEQCAEWGNISEDELLQVHGNRIWKVPKTNWTYCKNYDQVKARLDKLNKKEKLEVTQ